MNHEHGKTCKLLEPFNRLADLASAIFSHDFLSLHVNFRQNQVHLKLQINFTQNHVKHLSKYFK